MENINKKNNILIVTQRVDINDDVLGFMHGWVTEFAKHCEKVTVIALGVGEYNLPKNVRVLSLGKDSQLQITNYKLRIINMIKYSIGFYRYIWRYRKEYDNVFVHMNKEYVVLGGTFWRLWKKKIGFWYVHKRTGFKLRLAEKLANVIFTASKESFNIKSKKVKIIGHGIDINKLQITNYLSRASHSGAGKLQINSKFKIIYVGRISRIKNQELLIKAVDYLVNKKGVKNIQVDLVGAPIYEKDEEYVKEIKNYINKKFLEKHINFVGRIPNKEMVGIYSRADLSVNLCPTGGMDKAVLESIASGVPVIALNKTFLSILKDFKDKFILENDDEKELAKKIKQIINLPTEEKQAMAKILREKIVKNYSLDNLIKNIIDSLSNNLLL